MSITRDVVERYNLELWNHRRFELGHELLGEQVIRHGPDGRDVLSRDEAISRVEKLWSTVEHVEFTLVHTVVDGEFCAIVYQAEMRLPGGANDAIATEPVRAGVRLAQVSSTAQNVAGLRPQRA